MNISGNGKVAAAAYGDGAIRWHCLTDGEELLALFVHDKDRRFIAWTPKGYYADAAPDFYPASTFASTFNRPDIVKAALNEANNAPLPPPSESLLDKVRKWF